MNAEAAVLAWEAELGASSMRRVDLVLIGARGQVGSAFRRQFARQRKALQAEGFDLRLIAAFDRRGFSFDENGLAPEHMDEEMPARENGDSERLMEHLCANHAVRTMVIDCTASDEIADLYPRLLASRVGVIAANKRANARSLEYYRQLQRLARVHCAPYRYETTVGAAIPLLGPLRDLRLRGERVVSIKGVLSGSLSYILHRMHEGCAFSVAVESARRLGYTEPNPLEDLRAVDLSRKLLILAREAGFMLELEDLEIVPLTNAADSDSGNLAERLRDEDAIWARRIAEAAQRDERWVAMAEVDSQGGRVAIRSVSEKSAFAQLLPGQNQITVFTELQDRVPLSVSGPGAGVEITAAGVLSDIAAAAALWTK